MRRIVLAASLAVAAGCAAAREPSKPIVEFPSPSALAAVEAKTVEVPAIPAAPVPDEGWTVEAAQTVTTLGEPWTPRGDWEVAFAHAHQSSGRKASLTRAMSCVAAELARFRALQQDGPPEALQRFMAASCGVFAPAVGYYFLSGAVPRAVPDAQLLAQWGKRLGPELLGRLPNEAREIGFATSRQKGRMVVLAAYSVEPVQLTTLSLVPDDKGDVVIEGRYLGGDVGFFESYINHGRFSVRACLVDPAVARPQFRVTCRMAADDDTAWLQIAFAPPRRVLMSALVQVLVRRDATAPLVFPRAESTGVASDVASFGAAALKKLNAARAQAGLKSVTLAAVQSQRAGRLARQYFAAALARDAIEQAETIALGLMAGWEVVGTIRDGGFYSSIVPNARDAGLWLDATLALPLGRETLMAPFIDEVAFGAAVFDDAKTIGAVVASYRFQHGNDHADDVDAVYQRIAAARKRMNLSAPENLGVDALLRYQLERVQQGKETPSSALESALQIAADRWEANMRGIVIEATSLDALEIPPEVFQQRRMRLGVGVTHYKPPGAAWAQLVIVVVYVDAPLIKA